MEKIVSPYKSLKEFRIAQPRAYAFALTNNLLDNLILKHNWEYKKAKKWTLEICKQDALKYKTKIEWKKGSNGSYRKASRKKWLEICCKHMKKKIKWTINRCKKIALNYNNKVEWRKSHLLSYKVAFKNKWLIECCEHMTKTKKPKICYTLEICKENALKYTRKVDWRNKDRRYYKRAIENKWIDECCKHMIGNKPKIYYTLEICKENALKYTRKVDWRNKDRKYYKWAFENKWIDECCKHMIK